MKIEKETTILLVEDNPDDEALAIRAFRKNNIKSEIRFIVLSRRKMLFI